MTPIVALLGIAIATATADSTFSRDPLAEVVVTGSNESVSKNLLPYTVSVVGTQQLEAAPQTKLLSILSGRVPSLYVTQRGVLGFGVSTGGSGHIKLRGVGGDRASAVLMMVDGQPQFAGIYSHQIADFYSKEYVDRVEVLRGPGSVLYGSNAMAGVINVITKHPENDGVNTSMEVRGGSFNTWQASATNMVKYGNFTSLVAGGYDHTDGSVKDFSFNQAYGYAKLAYRMSPNWQAVADYTITNFKGNDPLYPKLANEQSTDIYHQSVTRGEASLTAVNRYGSRTNGSARIYYSYGNHFIDDPHHFHSTDDRLGLLLFQNINIFEHSSWTVGFDFDRYSGRIPVSGGRPHTQGSLSTLEPKHITEYSPYITASQRLFSNILTLNAGVRVAMSSMFRSQWVPQAGFAINPIQSDDFTIKGSMAKGYRNPSFRELYLYRMANPDLQPEQMVNYEVSLDKSFGRWLSLSVTGYFTRGSQMIQTINARNTNTGRFYNKGIETTILSRPMSSLTLHASYSYLHSSLRNLTCAPRHQYYIGADWTPIKKLQLSAMLNGVARMLADVDMPLQSYATLAFNSVCHMTDNIALTLALENITCARYTIVPGYEMPGITAMGGIKLKF